MVVEGSAKTFMYVPGVRETKSQRCAAYVLYGKPHMVTLTHSFPMFFLILPEIIRKLQALLPAKLLKTLVIFHGRSPFSERLSVTDFI